MLFEVIIFILVYLVILCQGLSRSSKVLDTEKLNKRDFWTIQGALFFGLFLITIFADYVLDTRTIKPFLDAVTYFELGSYSLIVTAMFFDRARKNKAPYRIKRICLLTIVSTLIFFAIGFFLSLGQILDFNQNWMVEIVPHIQNAGFFVGAYNLIFAIAILLNYFLDDEPSGKNI